MRRIRDGTHDDHIRRHGGALQTRLDDPLRSHRVPDQYDGSDSQRLDQQPQGVRHRRDIDIPARFGKPRETGKVDRVDIPLLREEVVET